MKLEDILKEWSKDCEIDDTKLDEESLKTARLHSKYLQFLSAIKSLIHRHKQKLNALSHDKKRWLQGRMTKDEMDQKNWDYDPFKGGSKPMKSELDGWIKVDPEVQAIQSKIDELKICEDALLDIMNHINWRHTHIRNAIDWQRFTAGG